MSILVIDDDRNICEMLSGILEDRGYEVNVSNTGGEGLEMAEQVDFTIAILDIQLPDTNGIDLLKTIKKRYPKSYCIMVTGHADLQNSIKALNEGAYAYMLKPLDVDVVLSMVKRAQEDYMLREAFEASEKEYRGLVEQSPDGIIRVEAAKSKIVSLNRAFADIFGYETEELLGQPSTFIWRDLDKHKNMLESSAEGGVIKDFEMTHERKDGTPITTNSSVRAVYDRDGAITARVVIVRDVTEQKKMELEVLNAKEEAELYLDLMSHDITNKIHAGFVARYLLTTEDLTGQQRKLLEMVSGSVEESTRIIENVKKLQKIKHDDQQKLMAVDLDDLLRSLIEKYRETPAKKVEVNYEPYGVQVMADELLEEVFTNLFDNSVKYSDESVTIDISVEDRDKKVLISFEDNGNGIRDEFKERIFNRLERGKESVHGSGLGLYLVKTLLFNYGGKISCEDRVAGDLSQGTRFVIVLMKHR